MMVYKGGIPMTHAIQEGVWWRLIGLFSSNFSRRRTHTRVFPKSVHDKVRAFWFVCMDYGCFSLSMLDFSLGLYLALSYRLMSISIEGKVDIIFGSSASPRGSQYANKEVIQKQGIEIERSTQSESTCIYQKQAQRHGRQDTIWYG